MDTLLSAFAFEFNLRRYTEELGIHHLVVKDWGHGVDGNRNVFNISIPTCLDPSQAPTGKHTVHIYGAANEPYSAWEAGAYTRPLFGSR